MSNPSDSIPLSNLSVLVGQLVEDLKSFEQSGASVSNLTGFALHALLFAERLSNLNGIQKRQLVLDALTKFLNSNPNIEVTSKVILIEGLPDMIDAVISATKITELAMSRCCSCLP